MKRYEVEVIVTVVMDDNTDEESAYDAVAEFMSVAHASVSTRHPQTWNMIEECVTDVSIDPELDRIMRPFQHEGRVR